MAVYKPPTNLDSIEWNRPSVFLAGSIEMGKAIDWQEETSFFLRDYIILNPRRDNWDSSWEQDISNLNFKEQVEWELEALERVDNILFYFQPGTKSPISLLELGIHSKSDKVVVCCPEGFWRRGNIEITCKKYKIPFYNDLFSATEDILLR